MIRAFTQRGVWGDVVSPKNTFFSIRRGLRPRLMEKGKVLGGHSPSKPPVLPKARSPTAQVLSISTRRRVRKEAEYGFFAGAAHALCGARYSRKRSNDRRGRCPPACG